MHPAAVHPLVRQMKVMLVAGVHDALSARLAQRAGFSSVVVSGYAVAASYLAEPDFGLLTQTEILDVARRVRRAVTIPVMVDGDTGHGGALNVMRLVAELVAMKCNGVLLEDQTWPKRCGHMRDKSVIPMAEHVEKIRAAREAAGTAPFFITARTDALAPLGLDEAIRRGNAYRDAGANLIFIEAPETVEQLQRIAAEVPGPKVINMIEGGRTPILPLETVHELGFFSVGYVLSGVFAAARAMADTYAHLLEHGTTDAIRDRLMAFDEFTSVVGLDDKYALDERFRAP
jgi:methylisocitrate lyase